jgi:hypothetical protein
VALFAPPDAAPVRTSPREAYELVAAAARRQGASAPVFDAWLPGQRAGVRPRWAVTIDIPDDAGATVISIEVLRERRAGQAKPACEHMRIHLDRMAAEVECRDCGVRVNPIEWIAEVAKRWEHVTRTTKTLRNERARLELRRRVVCRCGETIHLLGRPEDEKRRAASREARLAKALEHISVLVPAAAAEHAARVAREALNVSEAL